MGSIKTGPYYFTTKPWVLIRDFNICRYTEEEIGGKELSINKLEDFNDYITLCGLANVESIRLGWSWHNRQQGSSIIYGQLDRALFNINWLNILPEAYIEQKTTSTSDHTPLMLHLKQLTNHGPKLDTVQDELHSEENKIRANLQVWLDHEDEELRQRSRQLWL